MLINCSADTRLAAMTGATLSDHRARTAPQGVDASSPAPASSEETVWLDEAGGAAAEASSFGGGGDDDDSDTDSSTDSDV
jgi:hypothetical protein